MNQSRFSAGRVFVWANFLAMSWTWCIGMYLPVLLLRDVGNWGFIAFAVPNVIGAAAMGWVLSGESSRRWVVENRSACIWFSRITLAFHGFFAAWMIRQIAGPAVGLAGAVIVFVLWMLATLRNGSLIAAVAALAVSLTAIVWGWHNGNIPFAAVPLQHSAWEFQPGTMLGLGCACFFGFGLCPYLDLTFHAARRALPEAEARAAFSLGFGGIFLLMILFTAAYSGWFVGDTQTDLPQLFHWLLAGHLLVQSCLKIVLHTQQLRAVGKPAILELAAWIVPGVLLGILYFGPNSGEMIYRGFLGFYGLIFPAYVWLRAIRPRRSGYHFLAAVAIALPMFYLAFIQNILIWAAPAVAVVLLAKAVRPRPTEHPAAPVGEIQK